MARINWPSIAKVLREKYVSGSKCTVCGAMIEEAPNVLKTLANIYRHFKENHPDIVEKVKSEIS